MRASPTLSAAARRRLLVLLVACVAGNSAWAASIFLVDRPPSGYVPLWDGWIYHIASALPAVLAGARAVLDRRARVQWGLMATAIAANLVGDLVFTFHDQRLDPVPFPAPSDLPYLASYVFLAAAVVVATQRRVGRVGWAVRMDGLVLGCTVAAVIVAGWLAPALQQSGSGWGAAVALAYPVFDVAIVVAVVAGLAPLRFRPDPSTTLLLGALALSLWGNIVYLRQVATDDYVVGTALDLTWPLAMAGYGLAAWAPARRATRRSQPRTSDLMFLPAAAAVVALVILAVGIGGHLSPLAAGLAMAAVAAALARVVLTAAELRRANDAFRQARTDELTGLLNRRGFVEDAQALLAPGPATVAAAPSIEPTEDADVAVLVIDLDGFKEVNDSLGHHAGDALLRVVAERFARAVPGDGVLGRLGGDEFGIAVRDEPARVDAIVDAVSTTLDDPIALDEISVRVGASVGIARRPDHGSTLHELLRAADVAMYVAKTGHRRSSWYRPEQDPHSRDRLELIEDLRTAIDERTLDLHYQPTVAVDSGRIVGMEALVRWHHPRRGEVPPAEFIPLAERVGLIPAITRAVLDLGIEHLARTLRAGHDLRLSVNISALDLVDDDLPGYVAATLAAHEVPAARLTLEITETALSTDEVRAERILQQLRAQGVRVSIDDFGVGYSSMSQLLKLPVDELKLDRSFVSAIEEDVRARAVLSATVELGRTLGLEVVAEGVETADALAVVEAGGVDTVQGWYFSHALPADRFLEFVERSLPGAAVPTNRDART